MRCIQYTVSREVVYQDACRLLRVCLKFRDYKRCCSANLLTSLLMQASMRLVSLYQSFSMCVRTCCYETARKALLFNLPNLPLLESWLNSALAVRLPASLKRRSQRLALDLVLTPYHGQPQEDPNEIYRGRYKSGTSHFHAYATLYVVRRGQRFTIALTSVKADSAQHLDLDALQVALDSPPRSQETQRTTPARSAIPRLPAGCGQRATPTVRSANY